MNKSRSEMKKEIVKMVKALDKECDDYNTSLEEFRDIINEALFEEHGLTTEKKTFILKLDIEDSVKNLVDEIT